MDHLSPQITPRIVTASANFLGYLLGFTSCSIKKMIIVLEKLSRVTCYMTDMWFEFCYKCRTKGPRVFLFINQAMQL